LALFWGVWHGNFNDSLLFQLRKLVLFKGSR
jgi:hypothetical protein